MFMKNIQDHIWEAFYKRKYLECLELNRFEKDNLQGNSLKISKVIQVGEIPYNQTTQKENMNNITSVRNMGETMCKYKNAFQIR